MEVDGKTGDEEDLASVAAAPLDSQSFLSLILAMQMGSVI